MLKEFKYMLNNVITEIFFTTHFERVRRRTKKRLDKEKMVAHALPTANIDYNDPVRKQLVEAKREYAAQQKHDYSHVFR